MSNKELYDDVRRYGKLIRDEHKEIGGAFVRVSQWVWKDIGGCECLVDTVQVNGEVVSCVIS